MKVLKCSIKEAGVLTTNVDYPTDNKGFPLSGNIADYRFNSIASFFARAKTCRFIIRPNGKRVSSKAYSFQMAENDFNNFATDEKPDK